MWNCQRKNKFNCVFLLQKESWVRRLSCNLSAGEVEMGWESLEFSCPPALPNHLISEPRVSSYSASTSKVDSTESRTVETFEWPASSWSILTPAKKSKITIHPTKKGQESWMFLPSGTPGLQNILHSSCKRTLVGLGRSCPVSLPFPVCPSSESPSKSNRLHANLYSRLHFFFFFWESQGKDHRTSTSFIFP